MNDRQLTSLAAEALPAIADITCLASGSQGSPSLPEVRQRRTALLTFGTKLTLINAKIGKIPSNKHSLLSDYLRELFGLLEAICSPYNLRNRGKNRNRQHFPNLTCLVSREATPEDKGRERLSEAIVAAVSGQAAVFLTQIDALEKHLDKICQSKPPSTIVDHDSAEQEGRTTDCHDEEIRILYDTLLDHLECTCVPIGDKASEHSTRLRLRDNLPIYQHEVTFDTLVSERPASHSTEDIRWQQLRFHVNRYEMEQYIFWPAFTDKASHSTRAKKLRFEDGSRVPEEQSVTDTTSRAIECGNLCKIISNPVGNACILFKITSGHLCQLYDPGKAEQNIAQAPSMSLSELLRIYGLSSKAKLFLAYVLARSIWQYYDSGFMKTPWTAESIHFVRQVIPDRHLPRNRRGQEIDTSKPYFVFQRNADNGQGSDDYCKLYSVWHRYPRILALGVILVEICREAVGERSPKCRHDSPESQPEQLSPSPGNFTPATLEERINDDFNECHQTIEGGDWPSLRDMHNPEALRIYREVVENCLNSKLFSLQGDQNQDERRIQARRAILYQHVVRPLEILCSELRIINERDLLKWNEQILQSRRQHKSLQVRGRQAIVEATMLSAPTHKMYPASSAEWVDWAMDQRALDLAPRYRRQKGVTRIRIAVLDTGYSSNSVFFDSRPRSTRLIMWKDFVENKQLPLDEDGHGTHVVSLAMKIAPAADICVARVAKDSASLADAGSKVAEAIIWAAKEAKADVVTMSFGFSEEVEVDGNPIISNAVTEALAARNQRLLFFAAAANDGGNRAEMFPARLSSVFSIHATDFLGNFLKLNPAPDFARQAVFGTLGEDVPGASNPGDDSIKNPGEVCRTGTSAAAPIAAGSAAMVLSYARLRMEEDTELKKEWGEVFWMHRGMELILTKLSRKMDEKRRYLSTTLFVQKTDRDRDAILQIASSEARSGEY